MVKEEKTLVCVDCEKDFAFTIEEQDFFNRKGFESDPKRCKECRAIRRKKNRNRKRGGPRIYRSPAFEGSAPAHQKIRGRSQYRGRGEYRAPASFGQSQNFEQEYRSPAFRQYDQVKPEHEYRAPGFKESAEINPEEEYRAPGFKEHEDIDPKTEYRSPGYGDVKEKYVDEKPMFSIVCDSCGKEAMVPFLPEEKETPLCQECYKAKRTEEAEKAAETGEPE